MVGRQVFFCFQGGYCKKSQTNIVNITNQLAVGKMEGPLCLTWQKTPGKKIDSSACDFGSCISIWMSFNQEALRSKTKKNIGSYTSWNWHDTSLVIGSVSGTVSYSRKSRPFCFTTGWLHDSIFTSKTLEYQDLPWIWLVKLSHSEDTINCNL